MQAFMLQTNQQLIEATRFHSVSSDVVTANSGNAVVQQATTSSAVNPLDPSIGPPSSVVRSVDTVSPEKPVLTSATLERLVKDDASSSEYTDDIINPSDYGESADEDVVIEKVQVLSGDGAPMDLGGELKTYIGLKKQ